MDAYFSRHAFKRMRERTRLFISDFQKILDMGLVVDIGSPPGLPLDHLLFFSEFDNTHFVALQDRLSKVVVTVLPLEYYPNPVRPISEEDKQKAVSLIRSKPRPATAPQIKASKFVITGSYILDGRLKSQRLLRAESAEFSDDIGRLLARVLDDRDSPIHLSKLASLAGRDESEFIRISVRHGVNQPPSFFIDLKEPEVDLSHYSLAP